LNSPDRFTHLIHPYPAKLLTHIPFFFLANDLLSKPGDIVLDPFCGSGTVLLEAWLADRNVYGVDANPLARLIARVKTNPLNPIKLRLALDQIIGRIPKEPAGPLPDVVNIKHWFYPSTAKKLQCLREAIGGIEDPATRDFFLVCFSVCLRKVSLADPRLSVPVRLKLGQYPEDHPLHTETNALVRSLRRVNVANIFTRVSSANIARMEKLAASKGESFVALPCSDARNLTFEFPLNGNRGLSIADRSVQLIITSPPYPGAQKYIRSSSLSLGWLNLCVSSELRAYKAGTIGREESRREECKCIPSTDADKLLDDIAKRNLTRAVIAATYLNEMRDALGEMYRVLQPGGSLVIVAANNRIAKREFRTVEYLKAIADQIGLTLMACFIDAIRSRGLMTKRNHTASVITREWILIFTKGDLPEWSLSDKHS
jgi:DNA modification methylase